MDYLVTKITIKDDYVKLVIETKITTTNFLIRLNDYLDLGLKLNSIIDEEMLDKLNNLHKICFGYKKCLNKLLHSDKSVKEIEELLQSFNIEPDILVEEFKAAGLLDDEQLVKNSFEIGQVNKIGKKKIYYDLKKRKVSEELIKKYYEIVNDEIEIENGCVIADKYFNSLKNISYNDALNKVRIKLVNGGFNEHIETIMHQTTFKTDEENEYNNLVKAYQKALRLYQNKYSGIKLKQHLFNNLYSKGYKSEMINRVLEGDKHENY